MSETGTTLENILEGLLRRIVREEIEAASNHNGQLDGDRLLDAEAAAEILSVSPDWLYRHARKLPFTRKMGARMLRFSYLGILKWIETKRAFKWVVNPNRDNDERN